MKPPGGSRRINRTQQLRQLPTAVQLHVLSLLPPNERALSARFVCRDAWAAFATDDHLTASLSQPLPLHAAPWAEAAGQQHVRRLPFRHKLQLLSTAAASGSEVNLGVALAVLQPSIFPELLQSGGCAVYPDPGVAAVTEGHVHLLAWLKGRRPGLLRPDSVLQAAARHCQLQGLQTAWSVLTAADSSGSPPILDQAVLDAAAESVTPDAVAKMEWVLEAGEGSCRLMESTAAAAARSGDPGRLRWLHAQGCPMEGQDVLWYALERCDLATVQWLVGEAGCQVPAAGSGIDSWAPLLQAAAVESREGVAKLGWLAGQGAPALDAHVWRLLLPSARAGVDMLQHLMSVNRGAAEGSAELLVHQAACSGSIPVLEYLRQTGVAMRPSAYAEAAAGGSVATVRWLVNEAGVQLTYRDWDTLREVITYWPSGSSADSRGLLEAVQILASGVCRGWSNNEEKARLLSAAVDRGELALVQYLQQQLQLLAYWFQVQEEHVSFVAAVGCEEMLEWLVQQPGCRGALRSLSTSPFLSPYVMPGRRGDRGTLAALRRLGVPWDVCAGSVVAHAVQWECVTPAVRWLVEQGAPMRSAEDMERAVAFRVRRGGLSDGEEAWLRGLVRAAGAGV